MNYISLIRIVYTKYNVYVTVWLEKKQNQYWVCSLTISFILNKVTSQVIEQSEGQAAFRGAATAVHLAHAVKEVKKYIS